MGREMTPAARLDAARAMLAARMHSRTEAGALLAGQADPVARACHAMALRFHNGGKLIVFGNGMATVDAQHVAVEFLHPVIVGKRALPAISLNNDVAACSSPIARSAADGNFAAQLRSLARPEDIALGFSAGGECGNVLGALRFAHENKLLTLR
jgi:D-sedoheptulose 7-phosphate isomerase